MHPANVFQPVRRTVLEKPFVDTLNAQPLHTRAVCHAPTVFREIYAGIAANHGRMRRKASALPVHGVKLEYVRSADIGSPLDTALKEYQTVHAANATDNSLNLTARGENLNIRLDVLCVITSRLRPFVGAIEPRPANTVAIF